MQMDSSAALNPQAENDLLHTAAEEHQLDHLAQNWLEEVTLHAQCMHKHTKEMSFILKTPQR